VSFTRQKGLLPDPPCRLDKWPKIIYYQLFSAIFQYGIDPTGTPLLRKSIAGECGIRVTGFFGFSCMVCPSR
jgi:hypothetical protein